jgi:ubiquitin-protein ligase
MASNPNRRILIDIKSVIENKPKDNWDKVSTYYYQEDETNIMKGHFMLMGVENSPYYGGFYFFEHTFPDNYPFSPPIWKFLTNDGRTRFNPNLYQTIANGKVCLSILNTWGESSWSQVQRLSSVVETIRTHLFHDKPLINEPGYSEKDPMNDIYNRMITYQNLNFNIYSNIVNTPTYAKPFLQIMKDNFCTNKEYFQKYIDDNKHYHLKSESIRYDNQTIVYDFESLQKKYNEIIVGCNL